MPEYRIECAGDVREVYFTIAASEEEAREQFEKGIIGPPVITECSTDIESIEVAS